MHAADIKDSKKLLRVAALARRDALDPLWRAAVSEQIAEIADALTIQPGTVVSAFLPIRSEIDLRPLMAALGQKGVQLCLPAIIDRSTIAFREYLLCQPLIETGFGTSGPGPEARVLDPAVLLMPLAAFDALGERIGYGAGYYDRAIARLQLAGMTPRLIGVAFDCQQVPVVPAEPHDVRLGEILSESGLRQFPLAL